jgi:two-component sensor histidine kinase
MMNPIQNLDDAQLLAQAIVNTIPEPFVVLDAELRVLTASRSFYETFKVDPEDTRGRQLYALGDGQWDIPALHELLETILPEKTTMDGFEVEHDFPGIGLRIMVLNARKVIYEDSPATTILLAFRDITARRAIEREKEALLERTEELLRREHVLLEEIQHRVANSLQIIASILMLKASAVKSEETRGHLRDAHQRVMSVAAVQRYLNAAGGADRIEVAAYLTRLCEGLAESMIDKAKPIALKVLADPGTIESEHASSLGLIVTELVINAIKYAFPRHYKDAVILVTYEVDRLDWKLIVSDNGVGNAPDVQPNGTGLGTALIAALASQLEARVELVSTPQGLSVSITRATFTSKMPRAA